MKSKKLRTRHMPTKKIKSKKEQEQEFKNFCEECGPTNKYIMISGLCTYCQIVYMRKVGAGA